MGRGVSGARDPASKGRARRDAFFSKARRTARAKRRNAFRGRGRTRPRGGFGITGSSAYVDARGRRRPAGASTWAIEVARRARISENRIGARTARSRSKESLTIVTARRRDARGRSPRPRQFVHRDVKSRRNLWLQDGRGRESLPRPRDFGRRARFAQHADAKHAERAR